MATKAPSAPPSGFAHLRRVYRQYSVMGGVFWALTIAFAVLEPIQGLRWTVPSLTGAFATCFVALGVWGLRTGGSGSTLTTSLNLVQAGRLAEAEARLDELEPLTSKIVVRAREFQRALIAVRRGDLAQAEARLDRVLAVPFSLVARAHSETHQRAVHGMRAWVRAAAREDVARVRASERRDAAADAHASIAEALILEREGDRASLAALLRRDRKLLSAALDNRERAIIRAMQRMLKVPPTSAYRARIDPDKASSADAATSLADWLGRVSTTLAPFGPERASPAAGGPPAAGSSSPAAPVHAPALQASERDLANAHAAASKKGKSMLRRTLLLWSLLVVMFYAIWTLLNDAPAGAPGRRLPPPPITHDGPLSLLWGASVLALVVGLFAWVVRRNQRAASRIQELASAVLRGEDVDAQLAAIAKGRPDLAASQAELLRSAAAERRCDLPEALARVDAGRARLQTSGTRAAAAPILLPQLTSARASILAAMGRSGEAMAELATLPPDYLLLDRARFGVQLTALVAAGDIEGAGQLARATSPDLSMGPRDELVRDLARAATSPAAATPGEIARLRDELREDDDSRRWIERVSPSLLERFHAASVAEDDAERGPAAERGSSADHDAEREAAEIEAAADWQSGRGQSQRIPT